MGLTSPRIYLDTCIVIYLIEEHPLFAASIEKSLASVPDAVLVISALVEMECLVMPIRKNNNLLLDKYRDWFMQTESVEIEHEIFLRAAELRAAHQGLKTPDALHLAAAQHHGCTEFWTNDNRLDHIAPTLIKQVV
jgi:predicted nucleic acid-binding protein